jgi:integrase/recombinase XerD
MATITHREGKDVYVQWVGPDGKRHGKSFSLNARREAKRFAGEQDAKRKEARSGIGLEAAVCAFLEDRERVTAVGTWTRYESCIASFVAVCPDARVNTVTVGMVEAWRNARLKTHQPSTVRNDIKALRSFFSWCVRRGWCEVNPASRASTPKVKRSLPRFLTPDQLERLLVELQDADPAFHLIALFALRAGMRRNEILQLPWSMVCMETRRITIRGKSAEERVIPMHPDIHAALTGLARDDAYVFPAKYGVANNPRSPDVARKFNRWLVDHGWKITLHGLRHSFAVRAVAAGASERAVGDLLGHQDVRTTRIYARSYQDHLRSIVEATVSGPPQGSTPSVQPVAKGKPGEP